MEAVKTFIKFHYSEEDGIHGYVPLYVWVASEDGTDVCYEVTADSECALAVTRHPHKDNQ
jgi:hypothetical protein